VRRDQHRDSRAVLHNRLRTHQSAFSEGGLPIGAGLEDLGKGLRSQIGTMYSTKQKGVLYLGDAEGLRQADRADANNEVIGYEFVKVGRSWRLQEGNDPKERREMHRHLLAFHGGTGCRQVH
jgi:hypothetical protein